MSEIPVQDTRNIVLLGHTGTGKTTLVDAILHKTGLIDRLGSTTNGTSFADWTDEEKERKLSIWAKPFQAIYKTAAGKPIKLVVIDTPGYMDFVGQSVAAASVADAALIVVDALAGIQVGTNRAWKLCQERNLPCGIVITGLDKENADFNTTLAALQETWGRTVVPVELPTHDQKHIVDLLSPEAVPAELAEEAEAAIGVLEEDAAEEDDQLLEKYLGGEHLSPAEMTKGLRAAILHRHVFPVFETEALAGEEGVSDLLEEVARIFPAPSDRELVDAGGNPVDTSPSAPFSGLVWRAVNDPYVGQLSFVRVYGGTLKSDAEVLNVTKNQKERVGALHISNGKKDETVSTAHAGDIIALAKLKATAVNDSLCDPGSSVAFPAIVFPNPTTMVAVAPKTAGDDDKIGVGLQRVSEEDPTIRIERNTETHELILEGMGDIHIDIAIARLKKRSNVEVDISVPKIAYKETINGQAEGHYKHKKQSGGRGQYGEVYLRIEPMMEGDEEWFCNKIVGGAIPKNFIPAIEKGVLEGMHRGVVAGFPMQRCKVSVYDGSFHDVDSSEVAFKIAGARAFGEAAGKAKPALLEPICSLKVMIPDQYMGDITGDLNHRRGRILGIGAEDGMQVIQAEVPQAEIFRYSSELRSLTQGQGSFEAAVIRYDVVPANITQKVIAEHGRKHAEED
ncbi:MAG: elongation factor G [Verrucomicrobia bacterium]|nr:elongation factor G [Kiritimatiellia bacterium]MCP5489032.1 elongation factor G [Verrucomicrobiota bacterium]